MPLPREVPPISNLTLRFFRRIARSYFRRHFRSVMVRNAQRLEQARGPLIIYGNHSSWWDPMVQVLLSEKLLPQRRHYAPIDAAALKTYPILRKLGIFPIEMATARGAAQFLRTSEAILRDAGVLWLTPQGRFADPREFPLAFKPGLAALVLRMPEATVIPVATEYTFWDERLPEALAQIGEPVNFDREGGQDAVNRQLERALAAEMMELQRCSIARDPGAFRPILRGGRGVGGFYGAGTRTRSLLTGRRAALDHTRRNSGF